MKSRASLSRHVIAMMVAKRQTVKPCLDCVSSCKFDLPLKTVCRSARSGIERAVGDSGCGDDRSDQARAFTEEQIDQGDRARSEDIAQTGLQGSAFWRNRRFLQMCSHHLVEPVACTPASGWEKGQIENQVGLVREHFFTPRLRFKTFDELNAWLIDKCIAYAKAHAHPERADRTVWEVFAEPPAHSLSRTLRRIPRAAGFCVEDVPGPLRQQQILGERRAVGRPVEIHAYADRIVIRQDGRVVAEHARCFGRGETIYDPWHYVPVLARKPGALRNGAPFKDWVLPRGARSRAPQARRVRRRRSSDAGHSRRRAH